MSGSLKPIQFGVDMFHEAPPVASPPVESVAPSNLEPTGKKATQPSNGNLSAKDWIREFRARLKQVNKELKRLKALEREKNQLERLIKAAEQPPATAVRSIRSAG